MLMDRVLAFAAIVLAVACADSAGVAGNPPPPGPPPPTGGHTTTITVRDNTFFPTPDTIPAGTITFQWAVGATVHNVTWTSGPGTLPLNSGDHAAPSNYQATLHQGQYTYHCTIHSATMSGLIVVQ
jgi:plastocyanin